MDSSIPHTQNVQTHTMPHYDMRAVLPQRSYNQSQPFPQPGHHPQPSQPHPTHAQDQQQQARVQGSNNNSLVPPISHNINSHPDTQHPGGYGHKRNDVLGYPAQRLPSFSQSVDGQRMYSSQSTTPQVAKQSNLGGNASTSQFSQTSGLPASNGNFHPQQQDQRRYFVPTMAQIPSSNYGHGLSGPPYVKQSSSGFVSGQFPQRTSLPGPKQQEQQRPPPPPPRQHYQQPPPPQQYHQQQPGPQSLASFQTQGPNGETRNNQTTVPTHANQNASASRNPHPEFSTLQYSSQITTYAPRSTVHAAKTSTHPSHVGFNTVSVNTSGQSMTVAAGLPSNDHTLPHPHPHSSTPSESQTMTTFQTNQIMGPLKQAMDTVFNNSYNQLLNVYQTSSGKLQSDITGMHREWQLEKQKSEQAVKLFATEREAWKLRETQLETERDMWRSAYQKQQEEQASSQQIPRVHMGAREEHTDNGNPGKLSNDSQNKRTGEQGEEELKRALQISDEVFAIIKAQILAEYSGRFGQLIQHCQLAIQARRNAEQKVIALESQLGIGKNDVAGAIRPPNSDDSKGEDRETTHHRIKRELETEREGSERRSPTLLAVSPRSAKAEVWAEEGNYQEHSESREPPAQTTHPSTPLTPGPSSFSPVDQGLRSHLQSGEPERKIIDPALAMFPSSLAETVSTTPSAQSIDTTPTAQIRGLEAESNPPAESRPSKRRKTSVDTRSTEVTMQDTDLAENTAQGSNTEPSGPITTNERTQAEYRQVYAKDDPPFGAERLDVIFDTNSDGTMFCRLCLVRVVDADPKITTMDTVTNFPASSDPAELIEHVAVDHATVAEAFAKLSAGELEELRLELIQSSQKTGPSGAKGELRGNAINVDIPQVEENMEGGFEEEVEGAEVVTMKIED